MDSFALINRYHVQMLAYFIDKLSKMKDGDSTLLDNSLILYGSPMGDGNLHNHKRVPMLLAGHAAGKVKGRLHLKTPDGTPTANLYLSLLHKLGLDDLTMFADSTGELAI